MAWELRSQAVGQVKLHVTDIELMHPRACAPEQEKTEQWEAHATKLSAAPTLCNYRKPMSHQDPVDPLNQ